MQEKVVYWFEKDQVGKRTGRTICVIWDQDNRYVGIARCSKRDQFCEKLGRVISYGRAKKVE